MDIGRYCTGLPDFTYIFNDAKKFRVTKAVN